MKKLFYLLVVFLFLSSAFWLISCGSGGTETGNPTNQGDDGVEAETSQSASGRILGALCTQLTECFESLDEAICNEGLNGSNDIHAEIGFNQDDYDTFNEVIDDEDAENISANADPLTNCLDDIELLACSDSSVESAFSENDADNFNNIGNMVPNGTDSCEGVFE